MMESHTEPEKKRPLAVPFLETSPVTDLGCCLLMLPLWWILGVEQFIWPLAFSLILVKVGARNRWRLRIPSTARWIGLFLVVQLISSAFIVDTFRWLTFARTFGANVAMFELVLIVSTQVRRWSEIRFLLSCLGVTMLICALIGLSDVIGVWRSSIPSVLGSILPTWIYETSYGGQIANRSLGAPCSFGGFVYHRINSLFMFSTMYGAAIAVTLPICFYLYECARSRAERILWLAAVVLNVTSLLFTTARVAALSCVIGAICFLWRDSGFRILVNRVAWSTMFLTSIVALIWIMSGSGDSLQNFVVDSTESLLHARGQSASHRWHVYQETIRGWSDSPIFGWGTERDVPNSPYPAGSHSYYLGILYKHGLLGLLVFFGIWASLWRKSRPTPSLHGSPSRLLAYGRWALIAALLNSVTDALDLDATTLVMLWIVSATLLAGSGLTTQQPMQQYTNAEICRVRG